MKVWVTFALDWTGFDIIGVHKTSVEAESVCAKMKPFVMAEEQELPDSVPFEDAKEHFINVYDEAFKAKMAGSQAHPLEQANNRRKPSRYRARIWYRVKETVSLKDYPEIDFYTGENF